MGKAVVHALWMEDLNDKLSKPTPPGGLTVAEPSLTMEPSPGCAMI
jgi:hypothetical protein